MQIKLNLDIDFSNNTVTVSGDSQGIYNLEEECETFNPIRDAIVSNIDPVEEAFIKLQNTDLHRILFSEQYPNIKIHNGPTIKDFLEDL